MKNELENIGKAAIKISGFFENIPQDLIKNKQDLIEVGTLGNELLKTFNEGKKINIEEKRINLMLKKMAYDYKENKYIIKKVFKERSSVLEQHFKALDHALKNDDKEGIFFALKGASDIISKSPFEDIGKIKLILSNKNETLHLDF
ncbi:hypothetical protein [Algoriphagus formosus]|uniref:hypothetical protein n=1 Tax=Algoriphagus formosus TaxID=2007308 RepID=UPI000C284D46|nr:hypothetical protein [Algoriphagus formosus]